MQGNTKNNIMGYDIIVENGQDGLGSQFYTVVAEGYKNQAHEIETMAKADDCENSHNMVE